MVGGAWLFAIWVLGHWVIALVGYILLTRAKRQTSEGTEEALRDVCWEDEVP